jgi:uncharacterized tellurite resistance protein B-like protein
MFNSFRQLFEHYLAPESVGKEISQQQLHIAASALLIEMMHIDNNILDEERNKILNIVCDSFSLSSDQAEDLFSLAEVELKKATDYFQFTSLINKGFTQEQKISLVKFLWEVAYIDGHLDMDEDYMVRKVSDLLYVSHSEMIKWRNRTSDAVGKL